MEFNITLLKEGKYSNFSKEARIFLIACFFYHNGKINREKFNSMCKLCLPEKPVKAGKNRGELLASSLGILPPQVKSDRWNKRTYKCSITNRWYDHMNIVDIYLESLEVVINEIPVASRKLTITFEEMMKYVNFLLNKNWNYCLDYLKHEIVNVAIDEFSNRKEYDSIAAMLKIKSIQSYYNFTASGYCCEDHDGDYDDYKRHQYNYYVLSDFKKQYKEVTEKFFAEKRRVWIPSKI